MRPASPLFPAAALLLGLLAGGPLQAQVTIHGDISQATGEGVPCSGGGNVTANGGVIQLSGSCADILGTSASALSAAPGALGVYGQAFANGQLITLPEIGGGSTSYGGTAFFSSTDPNATSTVVRLNARFVGTLTSTAGDIDNAGGQVGLGLLLNGVANGLIANEYHGGSVQCQETGMSGTGFCNGFDAANHVDRILTMVPVLVPLNTPVSFGLTLTGSAGSSISGTSMADFTHGLSLPFGSDVFTVDAGISVNAPDSFIFDNRYTLAPVPEPATALLLVGGLLALRRRRRGG